MKDWSLMFTEGFRGKSSQKILDEIFNGQQEVLATRDQIEQLVVKICSKLMEEVFDKNESFDSY